MYELFTGTEKATKMANVERRPLSEVRLHSFEIKKETNKQNKTKRDNNKNSMLMKVTKQRRPFYSCGRSILAFE